MQPIAAYSLVLVVVAMLSQHQLRLSQFPSANAHRAALRNCNAHKCQYNVESFPYEPAYLWRAAKNRCVLRG